jgi:DNA-binding SARP family transcriptional activator/pimeloyl-ACP methyl ester carboxylesterase
LLLGSIQVAGAAVPVRAPKQQEVLALLALELNRGVSEQRLIEALWEDEIPNAALSTLRAYVSRLRHVLANAGPDLRIETTPGGYRLAGPWDAVDLPVAEAALRDYGRDRFDKPSVAARTLRAALGLWRGEPLTGFAEHTWAVPQVRRIAELHVALSEALMAAQLACGHHADLLPELEALSAAHPLRERLWELRMVALYRAGQQAAALRAYHQIRQRLLDELGVAPGQGLRALERAVLEQDPALLAPSSGTARAKVRNPVGGVPVRFTSKAGAHVAFRVDGSGEVDLLVLPGGLFPIDSLDEEPRLARGLARLGSFSRVIHFDPRGIGMSDPVPAGGPSLESWLEDALVVLDSLGCRSIVVLAWSAGAMVGATLAARHPRQVRRLVIVNGIARFTAAASYPWGVAPALAESLVDRVIRPEPVGEPLDVIRLLAPSAADDPAFRAWWDRAGHRAASPTTAGRWRAMINHADVRSLLARVTAPTLVVHRADNAAAPPGHGRYLAERIPAATYVELSGADDPWWVGDVDGLLDYVERFITATA